MIGAMSTDTANSKISERMSVTTPPKPRRVFGSRMASNDPHTRGAISISMMRANTVIADQLAKPDVASTAAGESFSALTHRVSTPTTKNASHNGDEANAITPVAKWKRFESGMRRLTINRMCCKLPWHQR